MDLLKPVKSRKGDSLLQYGINHSCKKFYVTSPRWQHGSYLCFATFISWKITKLLITQQPLKHKKEISTDLESVRILRNKISHTFLMTTELKTQWNIYYRAVTSFFSLLPLSHWPRWRLTSTGPTSKGCWPPCAATASSASAWSSCTHSPGVNP